MRANDRSADERSEPAPATRRRALGLVVGGTGVRGFAQAGVLATLERAGLAPDVVVGVSTGAIVAAAYGARTDWSDALLSMDRSRLPGLAEMPDQPDVLDRLRHTLRNARQLAPSVWTWGRQGYGEYSHAALVELLGPDRTFADCRLPVALVATDLARSSRVVLDSGPLVTATLAASALPGVGNPVTANGCMLIDGVFSDPVPVDVARTLGADVVLAVHGRPSPSASEPDNWMMALIRGMEIGQNAFAEEQLAAADIVVRPAFTEDVRSLDFTRVETATRQASAAVAATLPRIRAVLNPT